jgi:hypothetical protein
MPRFNEALGKRPAPTGNFTIHFLVLLVSHSEYSRSTDAKSILSLSCIYLVSPGARYCCLNDKTDAVYFEKSRKTNQPKKHTLIIILPPPVNLHIFLAKFTYMPGSAPTTALSLQHSTQTSTWGYEMKREAGGQGEVSVGRIFGAATPPRGASTCNLDPPCKNLEKNLLGASQPAM